MTTEKKTKSKIQNPKYKIQNTKCIIKQKNAKHKIKHNDTKIYRDPYFTKTEKYTYIIIWKSKHFKIVITWKKHTVLNNEFRIELNRKLITTNNLCCM